MIPSAAGVQPPDPGMAVKMAPPGIADLDRLLAGKSIDESGVVELCRFVDARHDCADFRVLALLRIAHSNNPHVSSDIRSTIMATLTGFRYWMDEAGTDSMCFWSENHQVIFAVAEYLSGQQYKEKVFTNPGPGGQLFSGAERMQRAKRRLRKWCEHRFRFGFIEWNSTTYYEEDAAALALLIDLADDGDLVREATMILDLLVLDMALHRFERWFVGSAGRAYEAQKKYPQAADTLELSDHFFGIQRQEWDLSRMSGLVVTSSYETPVVLRSIAAFDGEALIHESFGLDLAEVSSEVGDIRDIDVTGSFFWQMEAFTTPESIRTTMMMFKAWRMRANRFISPLRILEKVPSAALPTLVRILNPATQGVAIQRADVTTWRSPHGLLSSAQRYQPGGFGDQQHVWQATLPGGISVFATHPGAPMFDDAARNFSPSAWVGNGVNPHAGQHRNVLLCLHDLRVRRGHLERERQLHSHLHWPTELFEQSRSGDHQGGGTWLAGAAGSGFIGVVSTSRLRHGSEEAERIQHGPVTGWAVLLGNAAEDGSFDQWCSTVSDVILRVDVPVLKGLTVAFSSVFSRRWTSRSQALSPATLVAHVRGAEFSLHFGGDFSHNGVPVPAHHRRFDAPFVQAPRFPTQVLIQHEGQELELDWVAQIRTERTHPSCSPAITRRSSSPLDVAVALCDDLVAHCKREPVLPWMWGPALLGHALVQLDRHLGDTRYQEFLLRYADHHLHNPPRMDYSDHVAPALITWQLQQAGHERFAPLTDRALEYIRNAPRAVDDAVNHLGGSRWNWIYPRSIWVDSLMMFSVFPAMYGRANADPELTDFAARQPRLYAQRMLHSGMDLWHHSYWVKQGRPYPGVFWGRGNGWVIAALPLILDELPQDHPERTVILDLLSRTSDALLPLQRGDGTWSTVLADPRRRFPSRHGYRELSATGLIASGWLHAVRAGYLPQQFAEPGERALAAISAAVHREHGRLVLPEISGPTIPVPGFPRIGYLWTSTGSNHPWGVAAFVMAAINGDRLTISMKRA